MIQLYLTIKKGIIIMVTLVGYRDYCVRRGDFTLISTHLDITKAVITAFINNNYSITNVMLNIVGSDLSKAVSLDRYSSPRYILDQLNKYIDLSHEPEENGYFRKSPMDEIDIKYDHFYFYSTIFNTTLRFTDLDKVIYIESEDENTVIIVNKEYIGLHQTSIDEVLDLNNIYSNVTDFLKLISLFAVNYNGKFVLNGFRSNFECNAEIQRKITKYQKYIRRFKNSQKYKDFQEKVNNGNRKKEDEKKELEEQKEPAKESIVTKEEIKSELQKIYEKDAERRKLREELRKTVKEQFPDDYQLIIQYTDPVSFIKLSEEAQQDVLSRIRKIRPHVQRKANMQSGPDYDVEYSDEELFGDDYEKESNLKPEDSYSTIRPLWTELDAICGQATNQIVEIIQRRKEDGLY